jgi:hypothetical protein
VLFFFWFNIAAYRCIISTLPTRFISERVRCAFTSLFRKSPGSFKEIQNGLELGFKPVTSLGHGLQQPCSSPFTANARLRCI